MTLVGRIHQGSPSVGVGSVHVRPVLCRERFVNLIKPVRSVFNLRTIRSKDPLRRRGFNSLALSRGWDRIRCTALKREGIREKETREFLIVDAWESESLLEAV